MPVRTLWHDESQTILIIEVEGTWTLDEFYSFYTETAILIQSIPHPVVVISDLSKSGRAPKQFLSAGRFMSRQRIPNVRLTISVGISKFGQTLMAVLARAYPHARRSVMVSTREEAVELAHQALQQSDTSAP